MLGRFLELSLPTPDIRASVDFYTRLGFTHAGVGDARNHPYAVLTDGRIYLGLHQDPEFVQSITFVKPEILRHLNDLERIAVTFEFRRLGDDVFNEVGWLDPSGHLIRLVEARTFSPVKREAIDTSVCGYFQEIALPTPHLDRAKVHWEALGFVGMDEIDTQIPHIACTSDSVDIGLYDPLLLRVPTLLFEVDDLGPARAAIDGIGIAPARMPASLRQTAAACFVAPEGTPILMVARAED